jgi:hypothetical protein
LPGGMVNPVIVLSVSFGMCGPQMPFTDPPRTPLAGP